MAASMSVMWMAAMGDCAKGLDHSRVGAAGAAP
jgi:hypothetical protein